MVEKDCSKSLYLNGNGLMNRLTKMCDCILSC